MLHASTDALIERDVSLRSFNTFGVDASAALFARVRSLEDLQLVLADRRVAGVPLLVLGGGSNVLFTQDFDGCVLKDRNSRQCSVTMTVCAGWCRWAAAKTGTRSSRRLMEQNMPGLENLALIPGSVGAAPIQNIGAYGVELAERFEQLQAWDFATQSLQTLTADECGFGYRDSIFKRANETRLIVNVTLALPRQWTPVTRLRRRCKRVARPKHLATAAARRLRCRGRDPDAKAAGSGSSRKRGQLFQESGDLASATLGADRASSVAGQLRHRRRSLQARRRLADRRLRA